MRQDYQADLQKQVAVSVAVAALLLSAISCTRLVLYRGRSLFEAVADPAVFAVAVVGILFLVSTFRPGRTGRSIQVLVSFATACGSAFGSEGGDLTSMVFLTAAMTLGSEYDLFQNRTRLAIGLPLVIYVACFVTGNFLVTGAILASVQLLIAAVLVVTVFVSIIRSRLEQVRNREDELEATVAERTEGLRNEVARRARLEQELRDTADTSQRLATERALLLHELHHRTKNDLQLIASMIRLHSDEDAASTKTEVMEAAEDRIMAIALVHEYLYGSDELSAISLSDYLQGLISHMRSAHSGSAIAITEEMNAEIAVGIEPAIHVGLAVNELIQNSRKHAFPDGVAGTVRVATRRAGNQIVLEVADDGVGIGSDNDVNLSSSIGLQIVQGLVSQLSGTVNVSGTDKTIWTITLPVASLEPKHVSRALGPVPDGSGIERQPSGQIATRGDGT